MESGARDQRHGSIVARSIGADAVHGRKIHGSRGRSPPLEEPQSAALEGVAQDPGEKDAGARPVSGSPMWRP